MKNITPPAIDFSSKRPVQTVFEDYVYADYATTTQMPRLDDTPIMFRIGKSESAIDLSNSFLEVEVQIVKEDGSECKTVTDPKTKKVTRDEVAPVNNIGYALFSDVDLAISDYSITYTDGCYPWFTYIYNLLYAPEAAKRTVMAQSGWFKDAAGKFDATNLEKEINNGFKDRYELFANSNKVSLFVPLMFNKRIKGYLPPSTELTFKFNRAPSSMYLMAKSGSNYKMKILDAHLLIKRLMLTESALAKHHQLLAKKGFICDLESYYTKTKTIPKGTESTDWMPFTGKLPKRIFFWQIKYDAFHGKTDNNPYNLQTLDLDKFQCYVNGTCLPVNTGFTKIENNHWLQLYQFSAKAISSPTLDISSFDYSHGYMIIVVDLSADGYPENKSYPTSGTLRLSIDYSKPLPENTTIFCLGEYDEKLHLDGNTPTLMMPG